MLFTKKQYQLVFNLLLSCTILYFLVHKFDLTIALEYLSRLEPGVVILTYIIMLIPCATGALRWYYILTAMHNKLPFLPIAINYYCALFFNVVLPGAVAGDAFRAWNIRRFGIRLPTAISSVIAERICSLTTVLLILVCSLPYISQQLELNLSSRFFILVYGGLCAAGILGGLFVQQLLKFLRSLKRFKIANHLENILVNVIQLARTPKRVLIILAISLSANFLHSLICFILINALHIDASVSMLDCMIIIPMMNMIISLPISFAGWGVREAVMIVAFAKLSVPHEAALTISVFFGILSTCACLPGGILWLAKIHYKQQDKYGIQQH